MSFPLAAFIFLFCSNCTKKERLLQGIEFLPSAIWWKVTGKRNPDCPQRCTLKAQEAKDMKCSKGNLGQT